MVKRVTKRRVAASALPDLVIEPDLAPELIGAVLRSARERLGLSIADVSERTKVSPRFLELIDAAQFDAFVSRVYAIGFTRAYAAAVAVPQDWAAEKARALLGPRTGVAVLL